MKTLTGTLAAGQRAYALICPKMSSRELHDGDAPECVLFGWAPPLARYAYDVVMGAMTPTDPRRWTERQRSELSAMFEALLDPAVDVAGFKLIEAQHCVVKEAAWTLDIQDLSIYYEGASSDEYEIRAWCLRNIRDLTIRHVLLDLLAEEDRDLTPDLVEQIHRQMDEDGG